MLNLKTFLLKRKMHIQMHYVSFVNFFLRHLIKRKFLRTSGVVEKIEEHLFKEKEKLVSCACSFFLAFIETHDIGWSVPKEELIENILAIHNS